MCAVANLLVFRAALNIGQYALFFSRGSNDVMAMHDPEVPFAFSYFFSLLVI